MPDYMKTDRHGAPYVDCKALAADLAPLLGGSVLTTEDGEYGNAHIAVGDLRLYIHKDSGKPAGAVYVGGGFARETNLKPRPNYREAKFTFPHASASIAKGLPAFAKDIKRRVVDPAAPVLDLWNTYERQQTEARETLARKIAALETACPAIEVRPDADGLEVTLWGRGDSYLRGRMTPDGSVHLDRVAAFPVERLPAALKALRGDD